MKDLLTIRDISKSDIYEMFADAKRIKIKNHNGNDLRPLLHKTIITTFQPTSLRTKISFESGINQLGGDIINLSLDPEGNELLEDKVKYLNNWVDYLIIRYPEQNIIEEIAELAEFSVVNAMSKKYHPCEVLSDLFTLYELKGNLSNLKFIFVGEGANIANSWFNAAAKLDLNLTQVCPEGFEVKSEIVEYARENSECDVNITHELVEGLSGADIILTDVWPPHGYKTNEQFSKYQINLENIGYANNDCIVNPCPPFTRGEEVSAGIIDSDYFIGYAAKENLLHMQKTILLNLEPEQK